MSITYTARLNRLIADARDIEKTGLGSDYSLAAESVGDALARAVDCVLDNAITNSLPIGEGWEGADHVLDTYDVDVFGLAADDRAAVRTRLGAWLAANSSVRLDGEQDVTIDAP